VGRWEKPEDIPPQIKRYPRHSGENWENNKRFVDFIKEMAEKKGVTPAQVAIKWVLTVGGNVIPIPGATNIKRVKENMGASKVTFTEEELAEINKFVETAEVKGERYGGHQEALLWG